MRSCYFRCVACAHNKYVLNQTCCKLHTYSVCAHVIYIAQGKLEARKARRLAEERRRAEESAAKQYVNEQERQMKGVTAQAESDAFFKAPEFQVEESGEEKALRKQQVRARHSMRNI